MDDLKELQTAMIKTLSRPPPQDERALSRGVLLSLGREAAPCLMLARQHLKTTSVPNANIWRSAKMARREPQSTLKGRDAKNGQFIPLEDAKRRPSTTVVERVPLPGKGGK